MRLFTFFPVFVFIFIFLNLKAQNVVDTNTYHLEITNGNTYKGKIIGDEESKIIFDTYELGIIKLDSSQIKEFYPVSVEKQKDGIYWLRNSQSSRYFFSPNGYGLKGGEAYYQNVWVLVNSLVIGIDKHISVGAGVVPLFFFGGGSTPIWLTAKFSFPSENQNFAFGGGFLAGTVAGESDANFGIAYGIGTIGNENNNLSMGIGYGWAGGKWAKKPVINFNVMLRAGPRAYFISENYFIQIDKTPLVIISLGGRHIIKKAGLDYGLIFPINNEIDTFIAIPWLGITIPFTIH